MKTPTNNSISMVKIGICIINPFFNEISIIINYFGIEVNRMYNFSNKKNQKWIGIIALVLVIAMVVTTFVSAFIV